MTIGVYEILCTVTKMRYIGSSRRSIENRFSHHKAMLKTDGYHNSKLQKDYDIYGEAAFEFRLVKECSKEETFNEEQRRMDYWFARNKCYNTHPNAASALGSRRTAEQKKVFSVKAKARCTATWRKDVSVRATKQHAAGNFGRSTWAAEAETSFRSKVGRPGHPSTRTEPITEESRERYRQAAIKREYLKRQQRNVQ